ncbi:uncharacterized protein PG986_003332 [Apiospora aurea]|uniref:Proteophosphoglycan ppg4 n=1 Tax=Apiospora aurea TaxID=335848 RepID=A0ABR1QRD5_9PEZI
MQRHNSTKSGGPDRRKSISSVKSVQLLHMSPEQAERDARVAATQAFCQARERSATESALWPPSRQLNRPSLDRHYSSPDRRSNDSASCQQHSVRFVKPKLSGGLAQLRKKHDKTPFESIAHGKATNFENRCPWLVANEDYYTPEDNIASEPSSYRRIRKSKSLFSSFDGAASGARETESKLSGNIPQPSLGSAYCQPVENIPPTELKTPKSMSFLKSRRDQARPLPARRKSLPLAARAANALPPDFTGEQDTLQSFQLLGSKPHKAGKRIRRTLRNTSDTTEPGSLDLTKTSFRDQSIGKKARKASHALKTRIKSFFNMAKSENDEEVLPPQQIEAQKTHVVEVEAEASVAHDALPEDAALSRVTSGVPSLHAVPSEQQLRSHQVSLESLRSERKVSDEKSRVTSWTNSDVHTSTATSSQGREWDRQRLSVIKENGAHIPSSASRRPDLARQWTDMSPFANFPPEEIPADSSANVDSQRIYSALMKRLNETQQASLAFGKGTRRSLARSSADDKTSLRSSLAPTIRHIVSNESIGQKAPEMEFDPASTEDPQPNSWPSDSRGCGTIPQTHQVGNPAGQDGFSEEVPRVRALSARPSAFFGSPTCHLFRTQSPYRRALQGSISATETTELIASPKSSEFNPLMPSLNSLPIRSVSRCDSDADGKLHYSESIYSNEEEDSRLTSYARPLMESFPNPPSNHGNHGAVTIFVDPQKPQIPSKSHCRLTSTASSVEWKSWLSANVSKLEDSTLADDLRDGNGQVLTLTQLPPASGHHREKAQISDCDEGDENYNEPPVQVRTGNTFENLEPSALNSNYRLRSVTANEDALSDEENQAPPIPVKSALRSTTSAASLGCGSERSHLPTSESREKTGENGTPKPLTHARSANLLGPRPQQRTPSPVKLMRRQQKSASHATHGHMSSIGEAVERQFGKVLESAGTNKLPTDQGPRWSENVHPRLMLENERSEGHGDVSYGPENTNAQAMGSKQMVDLFLSSRRRRIAGSEEGCEPAFV